MADIKAVLEANKQLVWQEIQKYLCNPVFPPSFRVPKQYQNINSFHWQVVSEYPSRQGKYLRPNLLILTAQAMGAKKELALKTAAAMQVSEEWMLAHDDFEDDSLFRRGKPTLHRLFGSELAVNAGDALHVIMWKILFDNRDILGGEKTFVIAEEFFRMLMRTTLGQSVEIKWAQSKSANWRISDRDWFFIADGKTSYYTITCPMRLGVIIAGANERQLGCLNRFGLYLGRCFQLVDDLLDLTSDFRGLKKQIGNDIYEGKKTIMLGYLLRTASAKDKKKIVLILGKPRKKKTPQEVEWIIEKMKEYGSLEYGKALAGKLGARAQAIFKKQLKFLSHQPARKNLEALIQFIIERDY